VWYFGLQLRTFLLKPFKLITVFLHETSHTLVCKLTCSDVSHIYPYSFQHSLWEGKNGP
jgi:hypothetical protein